MTSVWEASLTIEDKAWYGKGCSSKKKSREDVAGLALLDLAVGGVCSGGGLGSGGHDTVGRGELRTASRADDDCDGVRNRGWRKKR